MLKPEQIYQSYNMLQFYRAHPVIAAYELLGVDLAPVQRIIFKDMWFKRFVISIQSRGSGKTYLLSLLATLRALLFPGTRIGFLGPVFRQAKNIFAETERLYDKSSIFREACEKRPTKASDSCYIKLKAPKTGTGSWIEGLPLGDGCLTSCSYLSFSDRFGKIVDPSKYKESGHIIKGKKSVWGNGGFRETDYSIYNGYKDTLVIRTEKGFSIEGTYNHKLKIFRNGEIKWERLDRMSVGDKILLDRTPRWHSGILEDVNEDQAYSLGLMIGDGSWVNKYKLRFTTCDKELIGPLEKGTGYGFLECSDGFHFDCHGKDKVSDWLSFWGLEVAYAIDKKLPHKILSSQKNLVSACLSGLFDTDGGVQVSSIKETGITVSLTSTSQELIDQVQFILLHYGIVATKEARYRNEKWNISYELYITGSDVKIFYEEIGFRLKRKKEILDLAVKNKTRWVKKDYIPGIKEDMIRISLENRIKRGTGTKESKYCKAYTLKRKEKVNQHLANCFLNSYGNIEDPVIDKIRNLADPNIFYDEVISITESENDTYDIYVPDGNEYCANGFFSHNSKIRGARFHILCIDEFPHIPADIYDLVISPMGATTLDPMANVRRIERLKRLEAIGIDISKLDESGPIANKIVITSSGYFKFNHMWKRMKEYWRSMNNGSTKYAVHQVAYHEMPEGFLDTDQINNAKQTMSSIQFDMEYGGLMVSDSDGLFKASLIEACSRSALFVPQLDGDPSKEYIMGVDPARTSDAFAIIVVELGNTNKLVFAQETHQMSFQQAANLVKRVFKRYNIVRIFMDSQGGGLTIRDLLQTPDHDGLAILERDKKTLGMSGFPVLELVNPTPQVLSDANFAALALLENKDIWFPGPPLSGDDLEDKAYEAVEALKKQLLNIRITPTKTGLLHFDTPTKGQRKDLYSAFILCSYGINKLKREELSIVEKQQLISGMILPVRERSGFDFATDQGNTLVGGVLSESQRRIR